MALNWRKILEDHAILQPLIKYQERLSSITHCKDWLVFRDGDLFLWDCNTGSILTTNLKHSKQSSDSSRHDSHSYKRLLLSTLPVEEVDRMLLSPGGRYLALMSKRELIVVLLPSQWDESSPCDGRNSTTCKCISIAEHLLKTPAICLVDVAWHPGSSDDSHIVLLTGDNCIRTYSIDNPANPVESICVGGEENQKQSTFTVRLRWAQGNSAVGFDFGLPVDLEIKHKLKPTTVIQLWPIYVLFGSGDVYKIMSRTERTVCPNLDVEGPLKVYPPAENAERNDACAILCIGGEPTVLIIASSDGRIDHCVVLDSENVQDTDEAELESFGHLTLDVTPSCSLYLYETVQLDLSLTSSLSDDSVEEPFTCMMRLYRDVSQKNRYFCMHNAGLHAVVLSWFYKVQEFTQTEMETDLTYLLDNLPSVVEHLVCTKPMSCSEESPLLGVGTMKYDLQKVLVVLTMSLEFIVLPLRNYDKRNLLRGLLSDLQITSPMKRVFIEPFDEQIRKVLQRSSSHPIIKAAKGAELSGEDCFLLLSQTVQMLRREHLLKLDIARGQIQKRLELHQNMKARQEKELNQLEQAKDTLCEQARSLAEKYEAANENQATLIRRLEAVLRKLTAKSSMVSAAEENMHRELMQMKDNLELVKTSIDQLKNKQEYQRKLSSQNKQTKKQLSAPVVSNQQQRILRNLLKDQGEEIADLVKKVTQLQSSLEM